MRRRDVERLLQTLLPALSLSVACDSGQSDETKASAQAKPPTETKPSAKPTPSVQTPPPSQPKPPPEPKTGTGGPANDTALTPPTPATPTAVEFDLPEPSCDTMQLCLAVDKARLQAAKTSRDVLDCPETLTDTKSAFDKPATEAKRTAGDADTCCYIHTLGCMGGRPLLDESSNPVVAAFHPGDTWLEESLALHGSPALLEQAANEWLADAAMEHASVASFGRVALELMALGAPADLLERSYKAALDEIRHAKTCLAVAVACGASPVEPGGLPLCPPREPDLARFAADTFVEGCVGETTAALVMERAAAGASDPKLRDALAQIARDESKHAALAWRTVAWAVERGGPAVLERVHQRAEQVRPRHSRVVPTASDTGLALLGRLGEAGLQSARHDAWLGIVKPMLATLSRSAQVS